MTLRDLPPAEFARLSALMDEALDRPVHERERLIDALAQREPGAAELLRSLGIAALAKSVLYIVKKSDSNTLLV